MSPETSTDSWTERAEATFAAAGYKRGGARRALFQPLDEETCALTALEIEDALAARAGALHGACRDCAA